LRLVGFTPEPPRPARAIVAFDPAAAGGFHLPAGFELASAPRDEGRFRFLTRASLDVLDVSVEALKADAGDGTVEGRTQGWAGCPAGRAVRGGSPSGRRVVPRLSQPARGPRPATGFPGGGPGQRRRRAGPPPRGGGGARGFGSGRDPGPSLGTHGMGVLGWR